jgi:hypothetical protein
MFTSVTPERVSAMSPLERRWLDNVKKAFADSDADFETHRMPDDCIETLFKGIDAAKKLRLSLTGVANDRHSKNKSDFIDFLELEIPAKSRGSNLFQLTDARTGKPRELSVAEIIYEIRCMIHENENLDERELLDYHILLRWVDHREVFVCSHENGRIVINARLLWRRLREILSKFITGIEAHEAMASKKGFSVTIRPQLGTIQPEYRRKPKRA